MAEPVKLHISSSPDLVLEREAVGQAVAELPVSVGWEIRHTPRSRADANELLGFIDRCDLFVIVLGADFAAPMGLEWQMAQDTTRPILAYRKRTLHSPSAQSLLRQSHVTWTDFDSPEELKALLTRALARVLLDQGEKHGLHLDDVEGLLALSALEGEEPLSEPDRRQGAGRSGVILGREG